MFYTARDSSKAIPPTVAFSQRGLNSFTQSRISDVSFFAKPSEEQVAFAGYRAAIEAFIFATATKKKVVTSLEHYPLPEETPIQFPLSLPRVVCRLSGKPKAETLASFAKAISGYGGERVQVGGDTQTYTIEKVPIGMLRRLIMPLCTARAATIEGYAQAEGLVSIVRIYQCISVFLATHSYEYAGKDTDGEGKTAPSDTNGVGSRMDLRTATNWFQVGKNSKSKLAKTSDEEGFVRIRIDDEEEEDLTPNRLYNVAMDQAVLVAKPSPKPSSQNFGPPSAVPFKAGHIFPYFPGLLIPDSPGLRELCSIFFRNFGDKETSAKEAYKQFRADMGTVTNTPQGLALAHILYGIDMCLKTQTLLFLMFDKDVYLGYCLLGEHWAIWHRGEWVAPKSAEDLRKELQNVQTHSQVIEELSACLEGCDLRNGEEVAEGIDLTSPEKICDVLGELEGTSDEKVEEIKNLLKRLNFPSSFLTISPKNIYTAVKLLLSDDPLPANAPIYIPIDNWTGISSKAYKVLAMFGPRSFSFRNAKGDEFLVPKKDEKNFLEAKDEGGKETFTKFLIGEKMVRTAVSEWKEFVEKGSFRMDFKERAAGVRNHVFPKNQFKDVMTFLREKADSGDLRKKEPKGKERASKAGFGGGDAEAVFRDFNGDDEPEMNWD